MKETKKATTIGVTAISIYLVNYFLRNLLGVLTPTLLKSGSFSIDGIATLSSTYMLFYAAGQIVNGFLGDIFSPKKMVSIGLFLSGCSMLGFPLITEETLRVVCFALLGFGLSMMRGPLMKIISENTKPNHARLICVFFSFASFAGPLIASLFAMINGWKNVFWASGALTVFIAIASYSLFTVMEKKRLVGYIKNEGKSISSIFSVFQIENIVFYIAVACLVEICAAAINQWITTFLTEAITFSEDEANFLYSGISFARSFMPFVTLAIFRLTKEKDLPMMRTTFLTSAVLFALLIISPNQWVSVALLTGALMSMSCTSALLWSIYIPGLGKTGKVSSINGTIDSIGYIAAAGANLLFAQVMGHVGWNTVYLLWASVGLIGLLSTFVLRKNKSKEATQN